MCPFFYVPLFLVGSAYFGVGVGPFLYSSETGCEPTGV
jgi:hypothetical protein